MVKYMLSMLMDDIKDTEMVIDYAHEAKECDDPHAVWFMNKAKERANNLQGTYEYIAHEIDLAAKTRQGDPIAEALMSHLNYQLDSIANKVRQM